MGVVWGPPRPHGRSVAASPRLSLLSSLNAFLPPPPPSSFPALSCLRNCQKQGRLPPPNTHRVTEGLDFYTALCKRGS